MGGGGGGEEGRERGRGMEVLVTRLVRASILELATLLDIGLICKIQNNSLKGTGH